MKKVLIFLLFVVVVASMFGCGSDKKETHDYDDYDDYEMVFSDMRWPTTDIAKRLPVPKSTRGCLGWSADYGFVMYVADTTQTDFDDYADECEKFGFKEDYRRGEWYMYADDPYGYHLSLVRASEYGEDVMLVRIDEPDDGPVEVVDISDTDEKADVEATETTEEIELAESAPVEEIEVEDSVEEDIMLEETVAEPEVETQEEVAMAVEEMTEDEILDYVLNALENETDEEALNELSVYIASLSGNAEPDESYESYESATSDEYSDLRHEVTAKRAFENYGDYICPYGIKYHWFRNPIKEYEGNGVWYFKVEVTITNAFKAKRDGVAEGRVDFNAEAVTEFELRDTWD